ncbi:HD domain-containing protein [Desulfurobacterium pacificum]|uniref:HD domain-containing protein n=1 Tax=Desulfurobacterium pacificum TaxID=240166 RepID=UPI0024B73E90|nr:HD domain-containing protein [Desulfurobacterium pacificum]
MLRLVSSCLKSGYIVGGFVRDVLLGVRKKELDVDLVVSSWDEVDFDCLKERLGVKPFVFEKEKTVYTFYKKGEFRVDLTLVDGETIEEDLGKRDFTVNAMAVSLGGIFLKETVNLIDPFNGYEDLKRKVLRPIREDSIRADVVRILRGIRFKLTLNFAYHENFVRQAKENAFLLRKIPPPRLKDELFKILPLPLFHRYLEELDHLSAFVHVFPELEGIEKIPPSGLHQFDLKTHTFLTVKYLETFCDSIPLREEVGNDFNILKLVALYHDVAKPVTVKEKDGYLTFYNHDKIGAEIAKNAFQRLAFGKRASQIAWTVIRNHLRPFFLYDLYKKGKLTKKAIFNLYKDSRPYHYHVLLHSVADYMATSEEMAQSVGDYLDFLSLLVADFERFESIKPLLSGEDIIEIRGFSSPNPCVGRIKEKLEELQAIGKVRTKEEAIKFVKGYCCS